MQASNFVRSRPKNDILCRFCPKGTDTTLAGKVRLKAGKGARIISLFLAFRCVQSEQLFLRDLFRCMQASNSFNVCHYAAYKASGFVFSRPKNYTLCSFCFYKAGHHVLKNSILCCFCLTAQAPRPKNDILCRFCPKGTDTTLRH